MQNKLLYLLKEIKTKLKTMALTGNQLNSFNFDNQKIILDKERVLEVQELIVNYCIDEDSSKILTKSYKLNKLINKIMEMLKEALNIEENKNMIPLTKTLFQNITQKDYPIIARILNDNISYTILEQVKRHFSDTDYDFTLANSAVMAKILGISYMTWWFTKTFATLKAETLTRDELTINVNEFCKKNNIIFYRKDVTSWIVTRILFLSGNKKISDEDMKLHHTLAANLGSYFVEYLQKYDILQKEDNKFQATFVTLAKNYEEDIKISETYTKPLLDPTISIKNVNKKFYNYTFNFIHKNDISYEPKYDYVKTKELEDSLNHNHVRYTIISPMLDLYLQYQKDILNTSFLLPLDNPSSNGAKEITEYVYLTYQLDLNQMIISCSTNCAPQFLDHLKDLLKYMESSKIYDSDLFRKLHKDFKKHKQLLESRLNKIMKQDSFMGKYISDYLDMKEESSEIQQLRNNITIAKMLRNSYEIIMSNKFFITNFIKDAYIFKHFDYFYLPKEIKGISRTNLVPYFLNYQTHRFARAFLAYYTTNKYIVESQFNEVKRTFAEVLDTTKDRFQDLSFSDYEKLTKTLQESFLLNFFKKGVVSEEEILNIKFSSLSDVIIKLSRFIKKPKEILCALSLLHYMQNKDSIQYSTIEPIITLDATNSVSQHIATILKNKNAATYGCLINDTFEDINSIYLKNYNDFRQNKLHNEAKNCLELFNFKKVENLTLEDIYNHFYDLLNINEGDRKYYKIKDFMKIMQENCLPILKDFNFTPIDDEFLKEFTAFTKGSFDFCKAKKEDTNNPFIDRILILLVDYAINNILKQEPWFEHILNSRDLIKQRIMPEAYGMTIKGGQDALVNSIIRLALEKGKFNINYFYTKIFAHTIAAYFSYYFKPKFLGHIEKFLTIKDHLKDIKNPLSIQTKYIKWVYHPKKVKVLRINVVSLTKRTNKDNNIQLQSYEKENLKKQRRNLSIGYFGQELNYAKLKKGFCVHIVHTQESYVMMNWLINSQKLHDILNHNLKLNFYYTPNYDCFGTNFKYIVFLRYHIINSYIQCNDNVVYSSLLQFFKDHSKKDAIKYIESLQKRPTDIDYWDGTICNDFAFRY